MHLDYLIIIQLVCCFLTKNTWCLIKSISLISIFIFWLKYAGLSKNGVDCAGFVTNICNKTYATKLSGSATHHFEKCDEINDSTLLEEGDLVFFKINKPNISHVGLYLGNGRFAHAAVHGGVMINHLSEKYYSKYYFTGGRLKPTQLKSNGK